jgi:hypothetical protein
MQIRTRENATVILKDRVTNIEEADAFEKKVQEERGMHRPLNNVTRRFVEVRCRGIIECHIRRRYGRIQERFEKVKLSRVMILVALLAHLADSLLNVGEKVEDVAISVDFD